MIPSRWSQIRVASKYPNIARRHYASRGIHAEVVHLNGAMELAPGLGLCRVIVDLVQTGSTLKANGLVETEVIAEVTSRLIVNRTALKTQPEAVGAWIARFRAALEPGMIRLLTTDADFEARFTALLSQARETTETVDRAVAEIIAAVRTRGDAAVIDYTARFDRQTLTADRLRIAPPRSRPRPRRSRPNWPPRWIWPPPGSRRFTGRNCRRTCG